jgi:CBS domain-containing protein
MATAQVEVESQIVELSTKAFQAFCNGISETFSADTKCEQQEVSTVTVADLKKLFKKQVAVTVIDSEGSMDGTFQLIFDQDGLFTLGGIITNLSEKEILANREKASAKRAESMVDAVGEAGNLLATSLDDIFREGLDGHGQFSPRLPAFIGKPWSKSEENIGLAKNDELVFIQYEITTGSLPAFKCGVIFPKTIFAVASDSTPEEEPAAEPETNEKSEQENPETQIPTEQIAEDISNEENAEETADMDKTDSAEQTPSVKDDSLVEESVAEEKSEIPDESNEPGLGKISEMIQKMAKSLADSPGKSGHAEAAKSITLNDISELPKISAGEIMRNRIIWISPEDSVQRALATMQQKNVGYLIAGRDEVPEGIVSKSDIAGAISPYLRPIFMKWRRPVDDATLQIKIKWIMSKPIHTAKPKTSLASVIDNMCKFGVRALPVLDEQGKVCGLITAFDILRILINANTNTSSIENPLSPITSE